MHGAQTGYLPAITKAFGVATLLALTTLSSPIQAGTSFFTITDDAALNTAVANARTRYIGTRTGKRLHATLLVKQADGTWKRGSYEGTTTSYPASSVKLPFMAAAMFKASSTSQPYAFLDSAVRPMIEVSDNVQTGVVVDAITGAPNTSTGVYADWLAKRQFTMNFLNSRGLLGNQLILNKTYPSNSNLDQFEQQAFNQFGSNQMQPNLSAELMLEIVGGKLEGQASAYMSQLLDHDAYGTQSALGWGLPAGSVYLNKAGWTSTVHNDIAYVRLPNGQELVVAAFSDSPDTADAFPHDHTGLGAFMDFLLQETNLDAGGPPTVRLDNTSPSFTATGTWTTGTGDYDLYGTNYRYATGGTAATNAGWNLSLPQAGTYEVAMWWTDDSLRTSSAKVQVNHTGGTQVVSVDQRTKGGKWIYLGTWNFNTTGNSIKLDAGTSATGRVIADAIKLSKVPDFQTSMIDNGSTGYIEAGTWGSSTGTGFYGTNSRYASNGTGSATATWTPSFTGKKLCDVYAWWVASSNRATNAKYTVFHDGGSTVLEMPQNVSGGKWNYLGSFAMTNGTGKVVLSNNATTNAVVSADAVKIDFVKTLSTTPEIIIDNGSTGFTASANWFASTSTPGYYGTNYHTRSTASVSDSAVWKATLPSSGNYEVSARWTAGTNRAASAPYTVTHAGGSTVVRVNQQTNNNTWVSLGTYSFNAGLNQVALSCWTTAGFYVVADAVKFVKK